MAPIYSRPEDESAGVKNLLRSVRRIMRACLKVLRASTTTLEHAVDALGATCVAVLRRLLRWGNMLGMLQSKQPLKGSLPAVFVVLIVMLIYFVFALVYMPAASIPFHSWQSIAFHMLTALSFVTYALGVSTDPGGIPNTADWQNDPPPLLERKKKDNGPRFCQKEKKYKPDRAHFCTPMGRNVLRMDHYCPWLLNCVGLHNHKYFFLFILYAMISCDWCAYSISHLLWGGSMYPSSSTFFLYEGLGISGLLGVLLTPFVGFHTWLISRNMTTIEFCEKRGETDGYDSVYDMGLWRNFQLVLGRNIFTWLIPVPPKGIGDGLQYPRRPHTDTPIFQEKASQLPAYEQETWKRLSVPRQGVVPGFFVVLSEGVQELAYDTVDFFAWIGRGCAPARQKEPHIHGRPHTTQGAGAAGGQARGWGAERAE